MLALACVVGVASTMVPRLLRSGPWERYRWTASSARRGFRTSGVLGGHGPRELLFYTEEELEPWLTIDLLKARSIHRIEIENRSDCCEERCVPLLLELAGEDGHFVRLATRASAFSALHVAFAPRRARYVRLRVDARTTFHLRDVRIL